MYHPAGCSVCLGVLAITAHVQLIRASLSEMSGYLKRTESASEVICLVIFQTQETSAKTKTGRCRRGHLETNTCLQPGSIIIQLILRFVRVLDATRNFFKNISHYRTQIINTIKKFRGSESGLRTGNVEKGALYFEQRRCPVFDVSRHEPLSVEGRPADEKGDNHSRCNQYNKQLLIWNTVHVMNAMNFIKNIVLYLT